jgi:RNA polymerase sigma-70 factor (ECF subfamily)
MDTVACDLRESVTAARNGESEAWDQLFQRYQLPLYAYVYEWIHQEQTSLDLVQETFISAVRHIQGLQDDGKFGSWLFGIAHQKCLQHWRQGSLSECPLEEDHDIYTDPVEDPSDWLIRQEQESAFCALLERLPPPQRSVVLLHFMEDFPLEDIARITGIPLGTVKSRLHHAKKSLRRLMEHL